MFRAATTVHIHTHTGICGFAGLFASAQAIESFPFDASSSLATASFLILAVEERRAIRWWCCSVCSSVT
uniref:Putative secreted peptide n=1 Tax=Anopheles braziliensis TaxID=58242 RepID=A0A2M3ZV86_9DIPT